MEFEKDIGNYFIFDTYMRKFQSIRKNKTWQRSILF